MKATQGNSCAKNLFLAASMVTNKHRTYAPHPTDGGGNPGGVMYTADEEALLDSERSAHEQSVVRNMRKGLFVVPRRRNARELRTGFVFADPPCVHRKGLMCISQKI